MLTDDLHDAMGRETAGRTFRLDIDRVLTRGRRIRRRRRLALSGAAALLVLSAVGGSLALRPHAPPARLTVGSPDRDVAHPQRITGAEAVRAFARWGRTRGSLATNSAFLAQVRREWAHPSSTDTSYISGPKAYEGPVRVLFAGQTPDGPAAVVAQRSRVAQAGIYVGVLTTDAGHGLTLHGPDEPDLGAVTGELNAGRFDTGQVSFATSPSSRHLVVLPTDPSDQVSVSTGHRLDAHGRAVRMWMAVPVQDGVAVAGIPAGQTSWDTLVRVSHDGIPIDDSPVWINSGVAPRPANALSYWTDINAVVGTYEGGIGRTTYTPWLVRHGAADEPFGASTWRIQGSLPDHSTVLVQQLWLYGDPAHTVVFRQHGGSSRVVSDTITDAAARPLLAIREPSLGGWLVAAGPQSTVTGYRTAGDRAWTIPKRAIADYTGPDGTTPRYTRAAALLDTSARTIQIRLQVDGRQRVVNEG